MGKYYTPKRPAIRFANQGSAMFKKLGQIVEPISQTTSDHILGADKYSGVLKYDINEWKRSSTVLWYPPTISDINPDSVKPDQPRIVYITGSNFVPDSRVFLEDVEVTGDVNYIDSSHISFQPPFWPPPDSSYQEEQGVKVTVLRPDFRSGSLEEVFFFEFDPTIDSVTSSLGNDNVYNDGGIPLRISGSHFKRESAIIFSWVNDSNVYVSSSNCTWENSHNLWTYMPAMPTTGTYNLPMTGTFAVKVISPSSLSSSQAVYVSSIYRKPTISLLDPNEDIINADAPVKVAVHGEYFLPGAIPWISTSAGGNVQLSPSASDFNPNLLYVTSMPVKTTPITASIFVTNFDSQQSDKVEFFYTLPSPIIKRVSFSPTSIVDSGSAGFSIYISGSSFSGSDPSIPLLPFGQGGVAVRSVLTNETTELFYSPSSLNSTSVTATMPSSGKLINSSNYDVIVKNGNGSFTASNAIFYQEIPSIFSITQNTSSLYNEVVIRGGTFYPGSNKGIPNTRVYFGSKTGSITFISTDQTTMTVEYPTYAGEWTQVDVFVQNFGTLNSTVISNGFLYSVPPTFGPLVPNSGSTVGGYRVKSTIFSLIRPITGRPVAVNDFATLFAVDGNSTTYNVTGNEVDILIPSTVSAGSVKITASNGIYKSSQVIPGQIVFEELSSGTSGLFEYVLPPTITNVSSAFSTSSVALGGISYGISGTMGSITGTNFVAGNTQVYFGTNKSENVNCVNTTELTFQVPEIATGGIFDVSVVSKGVATGVRTGAFRNIVKPFYSSIYPSFLNAAVSVPVKVGGTNFIVPNTQLVFSGTISGSVAGSTSSFFFPGTNIITSSMVTNTSPTPTTEILINSITGALGVYGKVTVFVKNYMTGTGEFLNESVVNGVLQYDIQPTISDYNVWVGTPPNATSQKWLSINDVSHAYGNVYITGSGFIQNLTRISFDGVDIAPANINFVSPTQMNFVPPVYVEAKNPVYLFVANNNLASNVGTMEYKAADAPDILNIIAQSGIPNIHDVPSRYLGISTDATPATASVDHSTVLDIVYYDNTTALSYQSTPISPTGSDDSFIIPDDT